MKFEDARLGGEVMASVAGFVNGDGVMSSYSDFTDWLEYEYDNRDVSVSQSVKVAYKADEDEKIWLLNTTDGSEVQAITGKEYQSRKP
jgi:hypothetical protein